METIREWKDYQPKGCHEVGSERRSLSTLREDV